MNSDPTQPIIPVKAGIKYVAGCDDATVSMKYGRLYIEFSRSAKSLEDMLMGQWPEDESDLEIEASLRTACNYLAAVYSAFAPSNLRLSVPPLKSISSSALSMSVCVIMPVPSASM